MAVSVVVAIFTAEYVSRFAVHYGSRVSFVVQPLNLVDLLAILPFYAELAFGAGNTPSSDVLRVLRDGVPAATRRAQH